MIIPYDSISPEALNGLIEQYIVQEHGLNNAVHPIEDNYNFVLSAVVSGKLVIVYSKIKNSAWLSADNSKV